MPPTTTPPGAHAPSAGPSNKEEKHVKTVATVRRVDDEDIRPYVLSGELGKGSFATVYKGYNEVCMQTMPHSPYQPSLWILLSLYTYIYSGLIANNSIRIQRNKSPSRLLVGRDFLPNFSITYRAKSIFSSPYHIDTLQS